MKIKHIAFLAIIVSVLQGCAMQPQNQSSVQEAKCKNKAYSQVQEVVIRKKVDTKFAYDKVDVAKAEIRYSKSLDKINRQYYSCVQQYERKLYEKQLRYQLSYK